MNENDKAILEDAADKLELLAALLENLSDEARAYFENIDKFDIAQEIEGLEQKSSMFKDTVNIARFDG